MPRSESSLSHPRHRPARRRTPPPDAGTRRAGGKTARGHRLPSWNCLGGVRCPYRSPGRVGLPRPAGCRAGRIRAPSRPERPPGSLTHALARLGAPDMALDDCTAIAEAIGDDLGKQRPGSIICMECALRFRSPGANATCTPPEARKLPVRQTRPDLSEHVHPCQPPHSSGFQARPSPTSWPGYGGNERFRPLIGILKSYMRLLCLELPEEPWNISEIETEFLRLKDACEQEMKNHRLLRGPALCHQRQLSGFAAQPCPSGNPATGSTGSRLFHAMSISQSAMYLGRYTLAIGTVESARHSAELAGENLLPALADPFLFPAAAQRRLGRSAQPSGLPVFLHPSGRESQNFLQHGARAGALSLSQRTARRRLPYPPPRNRKRHCRGFAPLPFVDPYILDMLYGFTRGGVSRDPRYAFRDTLEALLRSPNRQLRGAALRVKALCLRDGRADLWDAGGNRSRKPPPPKRGLPRLFPGRAGVALSRHELANTLERLGRHDEARPFRMLVSESIGRASHAGMDPSKSRSSPRGTGTATSFRRASRISAPSS